MFGVARWGHLWYGSAPAAQLQSGGNAAALPQERQLDPSRRHTQQESFARRSLEQKWYAGPVSILQRGPGVEAASFRAEATI